eukprot:NODE_28_length_33831_cov_0.361200.p11 type:complete len:217 gc:universal NODE_28_length_33831_cov_0.361200:800-1450(+)
MTITNPREEVLKLDEERKNKTEKLIELTNRLKYLNTDLTEPLVIDGFPRNDLDLYQVRSVRQEYRQTQNDLYAIDKKIELLLPSVFNSPSPPTAALGSQNAQAQQPRPLIPRQVSNVVLVVNAVDPDSPAGLDGLLRGDQIQSFNDIACTLEGNQFCASGFKFDSKDNLLQYFASHIKANLPLTIKVKRLDVPIIITPRQWEGVGLLGCHIGVELE